LFWVHNLNCYILMLKVFWLFSFFCWSWHWFIDISYIIVRIGTVIELFWLVNFGNIIQSERSLHILSEKIWFIDRPILLASYFLIVQSEELLLLKPVIFTKKQHGQFSENIAILFNKNMEMMSSFESAVTYQIWGH
jgi:hypothetical protein